MSEWQSDKLGNIIEIIGGGTPKTSCEKYWNGDIPWLSVVDFNKGRKYVEETEKTITREGLVNSSTKLLAAGDIIISARGTIGALAILKKIMAFNQSCYGVRGKDNISYSNWIYYQLKNMVRELTQISHGGVFDTITRGTFDEIDIELPSIPEQKAIASVLSSLDDKIDLLHRQNKTLESMAETLFRQWFIEEAQDDWIEVKLGKYVDLNKSSINKDYTFKEIEYLDTGSLTNGKVSETQTMLLSNAPSRAKRLVENFDILISTVRPDQCHYGICISPKKNLVVSTGFCVISSKTISPYFVYYLITSDEMTEYLHSIAEGSTSTYPSLKPEDIGNISFLYPNKEKIAFFHEIVDSYWKKIHCNYNRIKTLEKLRDTLLPKLMSGEVRVQYTKE